MVYLASPLDLIPDVGGPLRVCTDLCEIAGSADCDPLDVFACCRIHLDDHTFADLEAAVRVPVCDGANPLIAVPQVAHGVALRSAAPLDQRPGLLAFYGGHGGPGGEEQRLRMWPLPLLGPFALVVEWPAVGLAERRVELDARAIDEAAARAVPVWPDAKSPAE
jgi:hypothetical protein